MNTFVQFSEWVFIMCRNTQRFKNYSIYSDISRSDMVMAILGRAISEKALFQGLGRPTLLSLSETIEAKKKDYYKSLQDAQNRTR